MQSAFGARLFSPGEVAGRVGISKKTVLRAIASGELGGLRFNRAVIRVPEADLGRWLDLLRARAQRLRLK
jgi:excisionase family DNA binding protein